MFKPGSNQLVMETMSADLPYIEWQKQRFRSDAEGVALICKDLRHTRQELLNAVNTARETLIGSGIEHGSIVAIIDDYSPESIARFLALMEHRCVVAPRVPTTKSLDEQALRIARVDHCWHAGSEEIERFQSANLLAPHPLVLTLRQREHAGLLLFSSGSAGEPKAILHDLETLLHPMRGPGKQLTTLSFLLFDHIGGIQTLFHTLAHLGCLVIPKDRSVSQVSRAISDHQVELLPTSPTFLNLLMLENATQHYDFSSLKLVTYGTEAMPGRTLRQAIQAMPLARFKQTYGSSELGILRSRSASNQSLLVQLGGENQDIRIKNGRLFIKSEGAMLGYLNANNPLDENGWFDTGDVVVEEGEFIRIVGRESDWINVGGQKVFPTEIEEVLAEIPEIDQVTVFGEPHLILGETVVAEVRTQLPLTNLELKQRIRSFCKNRLQPYMIPSKVCKVTVTAVTDRFKKSRNRGHQD